MSEIDGLHGDAGISYGNVAVFYRTNAQPQAVEDILVRPGIPYRIIGGARSYERRRIRDALAYLHAIVNRDSTISTRHILNIPKGGPRARSEEAVIMYAAWWDVFFRAVFCSIGNPYPERGLVSRIGERASATMAGFVSILQSRHGVTEAGATSNAILDSTTEESGYLNMLHSSGGL